MAGFKRGDVIILGVMIVVAWVYYGVKKNMGKLILIGGLIAAMYWHEDIANFFASPPQPTVTKAVVVGAPHTNGPVVSSSGNMGQMAEQAKVQANAASSTGPVLLTEEEKSGLTQWFIDHTPKK